MYHYTYYSYEQFGRGYIGSRTCKCNPENDIKYFGSFTDKTFNPTEKVILEVHNTSKESLEAERVLHYFYDVANNPHFANKCTNNVILNTGHRKGVPHTDEVKERISKTMTGRRLSEETKNRISKARKQMDVINTPKARAKMAAAKRGTHRSEETKRKISETLKRRHLNKQKGL